MKLLSVFLSVAGISGLVWVSPVRAQVGAKGLSPSQFGTAADLLAQGNLTRVTGVEVNQTASGLELILKTVAGSERLVPLILPEGNDLVIDLLDATLAFSIRNGVTETNPAPGIDRITVNKVNDNSIRVRIAGANQTPSADVIPGRDDLVLNIASEGETTEEKPDEEIEIIATGQAEEEDSYSADNATTATRTDTALRDVPQSVQVLPQQVIEDQNITRVGDALRNVSGVAPIVDAGGSNFRFSSRGFDRTRIFINGFRSGGRLNDDSIPLAISTVERIEVLKGPASVLYGQVEPGGAINIITKKPLDEPFYNVKFTAGNFGLIEPAIDLSGPVTDDKKLTYRFNLSYQNGGRFRDFIDSETISISPVISYDFSDNTNLTLEYQYLEDNQTTDFGIPQDPVAFEVPRELYLGEPDDFSNNTVHRFFLTLDHRFNDDIRLSSGFNVETSDSEESFFSIFFNDFIDSDPETGDVARSYADFAVNDDNYSWQTDLISEFETGPVKHQLLAGFELARTVSDTPRSGFFREIEDTPLAINVFDPQYGTPIPVSDEEDFSFILDRRSTESTLGLYLQDQVELLPNLKLLAGGRYDFTRVELENREPVSEFTEIETEAFSPRAGLVYQPIEPISLYGSYSRSFIANSDTTVDDELIDPERGDQFEVGVRGEFGDVIVNLAAYDITKTNITRTDPDNPEFSLAIGEVESRGIELDVSGEPVSGWNIIASLYFNDAFVSEGDEDNPEDDTLTGAPGSGASLWTTYEIQQGSLQGFGFGAGVFYVGDIEEDLPNDFKIPSYVRADASLFYKRDNWQTQLNFRNLLDKEYLLSTQSTFSVVPADPFTVVGSVSVEF